MDTADQLDKGRAVADLESDVQAELPLGALPNLEDAFGARYVDGHGFFQIDVLTSGDDSLEMARVEVGRRGDDNRVDLLGRRDLLEGVWPDEQLLRIERRVPFCLLQLIEVCMGSVELILEQIGQGNDTSAARVHQIPRVFGPASAMISSALSGAASMNSERQ